MEYLPTGTELRHIAETTGKDVKERREHNIKARQLPRRFCAQCATPLHVPGARLHAAHVRLKRAPLGVVFLISTCALCNRRSNVRRGEQYFVTRYPQLITLVPPEHDMAYYGRTRAQLLAKHNEQVR